MADDVSRTTAVDRLRKSLDAPVSLVGGVTTILNIADVRGAIDEVDRLRIQVLRLEGMLMEKNAKLSRVREALNG